MGSDGDRRSSKYLRERREKRECRETPGSRDPDVVAARLAGIYEFNFNGSRAGNKPRVGINRGIISVIYSPRGSRLRALVFSLICIRDILRLLRRRCIYSLLRTNFIRTRAAEDSSRMRDGISLIFFESSSSPSHLSRFYILRNSIAPVVISSFRPRLRNGRESHHKFRGPDPP